jgi:two-component system, chemotaxis family, response regulator PixH
VRKVLVVDDDLTTLAILERVLQNAQYEVLTTQKPEQVVELAAQWAVDAIVLDVMMPGLSGFDVLHALRGNRRTESVPILFLSSLKDGSDRVRGLREGADDYLAKPVEPEELVLRLERLISPRPTYLAGLEGNIEHYPFPEVIQNLHAGGKSGVLALVSRSGSGWIALQNGAVIDATLGTLKGEDAVLAMIQLHHGHFRFESGDPVARGFSPDGAVIHLPKLLLVGAWITDELERRRALLPHPSMPLQVAAAPPEEIPDGYDRLPIALVLEKLGAGPMTLPELISEQLVPSTSMELAVVWMLEQGILEPAIKTFSAVRKIVDEKRRATGGDGVARALVEAAVARGFRSDSVHLLFLVHANGWKDLPTEYGGAPVPFFESQRETRRGGTFFLAGGPGELLIHLQELTLASRPRIEALLTLSAGVAVWLGDDESAAAFTPLVADVEGSGREQTALLVASEESPLRETHDLLRGTERWRFAPRPLRSLEQVLRRLS